MGKLTDVTIRAIKPDPDRITLHGDGDRLYLRCYPSGAKSWVLRDSTGGRQRLTTLGRYDDMPLRDARKLALGNGKLSSTLFRKETVGALVTEFYSNQIEARHKRPGIIKVYLDRDLAPLASKKLSNVTRADLARLLQTRAAAGHLVAANRLLAVLRQMFRYAQTMGYLENDPSALLNRSIAGGEEKPRTRVLSDDEIKALWNDPSDHQPLFRWLLASGQRIGEAQAARWGDIRGDKWYIDLNKVDRPHWVAVSSVMREVLDALPKGKPDDQIFRQVTLMAVQTYLRRHCKRLEIKPTFTPHDLRRSCATRMGDLGVPPYVIEKVLNHTMTGMMKVYNYSQYENERIEGQQSWANELKRLCTSRPPKKHS